MLLLEIEYRPAFAKQEVIQQVRLGNREMTLLEGSAYWSLDCSKMKPEERIYCFEIIPQIMISDSLVIP